MTLHLQLPCGIEGDLALPPQPCTPSTPHGRRWATLLPGQQLLKTAGLQAAAPSLQEAGANRPKPFLWPPVWSLRWLLSDSFWRCITCVQTGGAGLLGPASGRALLLLAAAKRQRGSGPARPLALTLVWGEQGKLKASPKAHCPGRCLWPGLVRSP